VPQGSLEELLAWFFSSILDLANFLADRFLVHHVDNNYEEANCY
jgi:hypothetical protein